MMIDENAFGVLVSYFAVEDEEYGLERAQFIERFEAFRKLLLDLLREHSLGAGVRALDLGHALYLEVAEGEQTESPLSWVKRARAALLARGFASVGVVSHGGRWVDEEDEAFVSTEHVGDAGLVTVSRPSEPLRRALAAEAASRPDDEDERSGWGPGLYLDVEAAEALRMVPKNAPTVLGAPGIRVYRVSR